MAKTTLSPREAEINYLIQAARLIISPTKAESIARILTAERAGKGKSLKQIGVTPRRMKNFHRATYYRPEDHGVGVYELAIAIATTLGEQPPGGDWYGTPFMGTGRNAELWTRRAVGAIQRHYGLSPIDELN